MQFWIRHAFLLLTCVVFPFIAAVYLDTSSEIRRTERAGGVAARFAGANLEARLTLDAHKSVSAALSLAQRFADRDLVADLQKKGGNAAAEKKREAALQSAVELVKSASPEAGFAWLVDETGAIIVRSESSAPEDKPELIGGHPLFQETQDGYALDGLWHDGGRVAIVGAAPLIVRGQAQGAILIGTFLEKAIIEKLAAAVNSSITLVANDKIVASTLAPAVATSIVTDQAGASEPTSGGSLATPLDSKLPFLPLFIAHDARGFAYTSIATRMPGADEVRWVISTPSAEPLRGLAERQELVLTGLFGVFMLALLIGLMNYRAFVSPIEKITNHLSELQQGRGELELPEGRVTAPFRRMVKLVNMMVQRLPTRGFGARTTAAGISPIADAAPASQPIAVARDASISNRGLELGDLRPAERGASMSSMPPAFADSPASSGGAKLSQAFESGDALGDAVAALSGRPTAEESEEDAIAQAIASIEGSKPLQTTSPAQSLSGLSPSQSLSGQVSSVPSPSTSLGGQLRAGSIAGAAVPPREPASRSGSIAGSATSAGRIRSAADIRGVPSESIVGGVAPFAPPAAEMYRGGASLGPRVDAAPAEERTPIEEQLAKPSPTLSMRGASTARGGGSLNLASYAGLGQSAGVGSGAAAEVDEGGFNPEATVVAPVADELLRKSASREDTTDHHAIIPNIPSGDMTMVASVPPNLLAQTMGDSEPESEGLPGLEGLDAADHAHFKETYERFIDMRRKCGEPTNDLAFDRFLAKLAKNREGLVKKYNCRTVRFQVYEKDGKAALKATPVRAK